MPIIQLTSRAFGPKNTESHGVSMKKRIIAGTVCGVALIAAAGITVIKGAQKEAHEQKDAAVKVETAAPAVYTAPDFYRGIYLTNPSGKNIEILKKFIDNAKKANINVMVIDAQPAPEGRTNLPKENIQLIIANGIHPVARIVCFNLGLRQMPEDSVLQNKIAIAKSACEVGFKEVQFDYVRFEDEGHCAKIPLQQKYDFIENFLSRAKTALKPYNVKIAADIFGRIPLNGGDSIGQRMSGLDKVVDVICPMAYPSHYTWSEKMMADPYYTVHLTATKAKERSQKAEIVAYIQAFKLKVSKSGLVYDDYVLKQIQAVHDSGIKGYILWNAAQEYTVPFKVAESFYKNGAHKTQAKADSSQPTTKL